MSGSSGTTEERGEKKREPTADDVMRAISAALKARDFPAVVSVLHVLAVKDPDSAAAVLAVVEGLSRYGSSSRSSASGVSS